MAGNINAGVVSATQLLENGVGMFGVGQTWQNVKASRSIDTTYTNTTGKTIFVCVGFSFTQGSNLDIQVNGVPISYVTYNLTYGDFMTIYAFVPPGASYKITRFSGTSTVNTWVELR